MGNLWELWQQFVATSGHKCSFKLFATVYNESWSDVLAFRGRSSHAVCSVCVKHRALLRILARDISQREQQRSYLQRHYDEQYKDRQYDS